MPTLREKLGRNTLIELFRVINAMREIIIENYTQRKHSGGNYIKFICRNM